MYRSIDSVFLATMMTLAATAPVTVAQANRVEPDPRVKKALDEAGLTYTILSSGQFKINGRLKNKRKQTVFINSDTQKLGDIEIRRIHSGAYRSTGSFPQDVANQLLMSSNRNKLGAWQIFQDSKKENSFGVFVMKIDADIDSRQLVKLMFQTLITADEMEAELTGADKF